MAEAVEGNANDTTTAISSFAPQIPIAQLSPDLNSPASIKALVTLIWPYSSVTKSTSILLAEPDFRLRKAKGQVRVRFSGSSGQAVSKSGIGSGDLVTLSLKGVEWAKDDSTTRTPGRGIEWELRYAEQLFIEIRQEEPQKISTIDIDNPTPVEEASTAIPEVEEIISASEIPNPPPVIPRSRKISDLQDENPEEWNSPAFIKRARTSYGSLFGSGDIFAEDTSMKGKSKNRRSSGWRYVSRSPSPTPSEPEVETQVETPAPVRHTTGDDAITQTPVMMDEGSQTIGNEEAMIDVSQADVEISTQEAPVDVSQPEVEISTQEALVDVSQTEVEISTKEVLVDFSQTEVEISTKEALVDVSQSEVEVSTQEALVDVPQPELEISTQEALVDVPQPELEPSTKPSEDHAAVQPESPVIQTEPGQPNEVFESAEQRMDIDSDLPSKEYDHTPTPTRMNEGIYGQVSVNQDDLPDSGIRFAEELRSSPVPREPFPQQYENWQTTAAANHQLSNPHSPHEPQEYPSPTQAGFQNEENNQRIPYFETHGTSEFEQEVMNTGSLMRPVASPHVDTNMSQQDSVSSRHRINEVLRGTLSRSQSAPREVLDLTGSSDEEEDVGGDFDEVDQVDNGATWEGDSDAEGEADDEFGDEYEDDQQQGWRQRPEFEARATYDDEFNNDPQQQGYYEDEDEYGDESDYSREDDDGYDEEYDDELSRANPMAKKEPVVIDLISSDEEDEGEAQQPGPQYKSSQIAEPSHEEELEESDEADVDDQDVDRDEENEVEEDEGYEEEEEEEGEEGDGEGQLLVEGEKEFESEEGYEEEEEGAQEEYGEERQSYEYLDPIRPRERIKVKYSSFDGAADMPDARELSKKDNPILPTTRRPKTTSPMELDSTIRLAPETEVPKVSEEFLPPAKSVKTEILEILAHKDSITTSSPPPPENAYDLTHTEPEVLSVETHVEERVVVSQELHADLVDAIPPATLEEKVDDVDMIDDNSLYPELPQTEAVITPEVVPEIVPEIVPEEALEEATEEIPEGSVDNIYSDASKVSELASRIELPTPVDTQMTGIATTTVSFDEAQWSRNETQETHITYTSSFGAMTEDEQAPTSNALLQTAPLKTNERQMDESSVNNDPSAGMIESTPTAKATDATLATSPPETNKQQGDELTAIKGSKADGVEKEPIITRSRSRITESAQTEVVHEEPAAEPQPLPVTPRRSLRVRKAASSPKSVVTPQLQRDSPVVHDGSLSPPGYDASAELALASRNSPSKRGVDDSEQEAPVRTPPKPNRLKTSLKTPRGEYTVLRDLRIKQDKKPDILAIATTATANLHQGKKGPRDWFTDFTITDASVTPSVVTRVSVFRPLAKSLPVVSPGDGVLLRSFKVQYEKGSKFSLRSDHDSSWAVFKADGSVETRGPPVEMGEEEESHIAGLKEWFENMPGIQRDILDKAHVRKVDKGKGVHGK